MSKYVVTGGAGFIGSALVRGLLREGASKVVVIDNLLTGHEANLDEGGLWPVAFALKELTPAEEARIGALVKKAVS